MYEYISGMIVKVNPKYIVVDNKGIGYQIYVPNPYLFKRDEFKTVYTYFHVKEDVSDLYGFLTEEERDLFIKLISVTGIGPKTALPIMAAATPEDISIAINNGDVKYLQKFPGIGAKAAQQIVLDLRGKLEFNEDFTSLLPKDNKIVDCEEALIALGYNKKEVSKAVSQIDPSLEQSDIIKQALKKLSKL